MTQERFRAFSPGQEALPPTTPGGLATGTASGSDPGGPSAPGRVVGSTNVAADGTVAAPVAAEFSNSGINALKFKAGSTSLSDSKVLSFPSSRKIKDNSDFVSFVFSDYEPPFRAAGGSGSDAPASPYNSYNASITNAASLKPADGYSPIILYMPEDIQTETSGRWSAGGFGPVIRGMAEIAAGFANGDFPEATVANSFNQLPAALDRLKYQALLQTINKTMGSQITENQLLGGSTGSIVNPNVEMMYEAPDLRNFTLRFKMSPRDEKEAENIKKICNTFRKASLPSFSSSEGRIAGTSPGYFLKIPKICRVSFLQGGKPHPFLAQYKPCAILRVSVNYTPDGSYATYQKGSPVATELSVTFQELKLIFSEEVDVNGGGF